MDSRTTDGKARRRRLARCAIPLGILLVAACAAGRPAADSAARPASLESLIGDAACDSDSQCHTIGVGAKACGGPERFLAWSSLRTDGAELQAVAVRAAGVDRAGAHVPGKMSNCALVTDPGAYCGAPDSSRAQGAAAPEQPSAPRQCRLRASSSVSVAGPTEAPTLE
jgi:hypothetical protein